MSSLTTRSWLAVVVGALLTPTALAVDVPWVGRSVLLEDDAVLKADDADEPVPSSCRRSIGAFKVDRAEGNRLRIVIEGTRSAAWVDVSSVVPLDEAVDVFSDRLRAHPGDARLLTRRGDARRLLEDLDGAVADYDEAIRRAPADHVARRNRGEAHAANEDYDEAIADYDESIRLDPTEPETFRDRAEARMNQEDLDGTIADCDEVFRLGLNDAWAHVMRGFARHSKEDLDGALADYDEAIRLDPERAETYRQRGEARVDKGLKTEALADFDEAARRDPTDVGALVQAGGLRAKMRDLDRALVDLNAALRLEPDDVATRMLRGLVLVMKKEHAKSIADFEAVIAADPTSWRGFHGRGVSRVMLNQFEGGMRDLAEAIRLGGGPDVRLAATQARFAAGRPDALSEARGVIAAAGWKDPVSIEATVVGTLAARRAGDAAGAKALLDEAAEKAEKSIWPFPVIRCLRGEIAPQDVFDAAPDDAARNEVTNWIALDRMLTGRLEEGLALYRRLRDRGAIGPALKASIEALERARAAEPKPAAP